MLKFKQSKKYPGVTRVTTQEGFTCAYFGLAQSLIDAKLILVNPHFKGHPETDIFVVVWHDAYFNEWLIRDDFANKDDVKQYLIAKYERKEITTSGN